MHGFVFVPSEGTQSVGRCIPASYSCKYAVASCLKCHLALLRLLCAHVQLWVPVFGQIVTALFMFQLFMVRRSQMPPTHYKQRPWLLSH